ncbi:LPS-assembly lipoprotein LptE [compost metagenome]|uniref:LPS-assembly lipoprotein LptE n=1 Tax=Pseudomonas linyingensis TaxID=915471 RepID=A0A1H6RQT3_9PSED|nr:LPS assembly lipoprotein LptE [Pseudomonas linyingensis]SEI58121.1 LPS-assembly lipoprotein [Pseudomonas linyingensis]
MKRSLSGLLLVMLATLLGACGFQLRGTGSNDFALTELDLAARNAYGETVKDVRRMLENSGVRVHGGAPYRLVLVNENERQRTASYTSSARSAEYALSSSLDYEIRSGELRLLGDRLEVQKVYVHDSNNLIGSDQEAQQLRAEIRRELVQQLGMRLQQLSPTRLATLQETAQAKADAEARAAEEAARQPAPAAPAR